MKKKERKRSKQIGAIIMASALIAQGIAGVPVMNAADKQMKVRSQSQTQMCSEPEVVYANAYNDATVRTQNFDGNWKFYLGDAGDAQAPAFDDSKWRQISLPHDYSIEQSFSRSMEAESGYLPGGTGWYRKSFTIGSEMKGKELRIDFGGVYMNATVWVNGIKLGTHPYGYTPFSFDITDYVNYGGENVIAVKVDHKTPSSRWYSGSGIYRSVNFTVTDKVHVDLYGTKIATPDLENEKDGTVNMEIATTVVNESDETATVALTHTIFEKDSDISIGTVTTQGEEIAAGAETTIDAVLPAENPELWSTENPALYTVRTEVKSGDTVVDTYDTEYGFRYIAFDTETGFYLNGENVKLKGVCMHHDQGALGSVANRRAIERQVEILKEMGCNSIRVTHNPAADELIEICNEQGILVIDEFFDGWMYPKNGNSYDYSTSFRKAIEADNTILGKEDGMTWAEMDMKTVINRGENAPSVIMWSLGNEIQEGAGGSGYNTMAASLIAWAEETGTTKLLTIGSNAVKNGSWEHVDIANQLTAVGGVSGTNYSNGSSYDSLHSNYPNWYLYGSETASSVNSRGIYDYKGNSSQTANKQLTSYDKSAVGWGAFASSAWYDVITRDFVAGEYVWTGFDYIGEPTPWNGIGSGSVGSWPAPKSSYFGIVDTAGIPKDSYYFYQSQWNDDVNTLHILPAWNEDVVAKDGSNNVEVVVYSDAAAVELFLNGESLGRKQFTKKTTDAGYTYQIYEGTDASNTAHQNLYLTWNVPFEEGTLEAVAYDEAGSIIEDTEGRSVVKTTGNEVKLDAFADRTEIKADGKDLSYITVDVMDAEGNIVPNADDRVTFTVEGDGVLVGVDNGNSPDHDSYKADNRRAFSGKLVAIVQSTKSAGNITVTATADGLESSSVEITTIPVETEIGEKQVDRFYMSKNYYVKAGNMPELPAQIETYYTDGTSELKHVEWDEIENSQIQQSGTFTVNGVVDGCLVSVNVNMIDDIGGLLNYSASTPRGQKPILPETRQAVMPDGTVLETAFAVDWNEPDDSVWNEEGVVLVEGMANVLGKEVTVTASIRVAEEAITIGDSVSAAAHLSQDIPEGKQDDTLEAIKDESTEIIFPNSGPNQTAWSNWTMSQEGDTTAEITFRYDTQQRIGQVVIWFTRDNGSMRYPDAGTTEIYISETGEEESWVKVEAEETFTEKNENGVNPYTYDFEPFAATFVKFCLTNANVETGTNWKPCTGITEIELKSVQGSFVTNATANLESLVVNGMEVPAASLESGSYSTPALLAEVEAKGADNAAVTVLPAYDDIIRIIIESEDHKTRNIFEIKLNEEIVLAPDDDSRDYPVEKLTAMADSQYAGGNNEGPASYVLDGNVGTHWHTNWSTTEAQSVDKRWIGLRLEETALIDAIRYLPRQVDGSNGAVTEYKVQYRESDDGEWCDIAIGTWQANDKAWKVIEFDEPTMVKQVRVVGVHTYADSGNDAHMSTAEMRVRMAEQKIDIADEANSVTATLEADTIETSVVDAEHPVTVNVMVEKDGEALRYGVDYIIRYENNTSFGEAAAVVIGIDKYTGEIRVPFTIVEKEQPPVDPETPSTMRELLQDTYDKVKDLDTNGVVDSAVKVFQDALNTAKTLLDNSESSDEDMLQAWENLVSATHGLGLLKGNKFILGVLIEKAEDMVENVDKYVSENWQLLLDELEDAQEVFANGDTMEEDISPAVDELLDAIKKQRYKAQKDILQELIKKADSLNLEDYTAESVAALKAVLQAAKVVMEDESLSEDDQAIVDDAAKALAKAMDELKLVSNINDENTDKNNKDDSKKDDGKKDDSKKNDSKAPTTGDGTQAVLWITAVLLMAAVVSVLKIRKKYQA